MSNCRLPRQAVGTRGGSAAPAVTMLKNLTIEGLIHLLLRQKVNEQSAFEHELLVFTQA